MGKKLTFEEFMNRINQRDDVEYISGFVNTHTKVNLKCKISDCCNKAIILNQTLFIN